MATNPLGIFSAALASGPHVEPLDVGKWMDARAQSQAETGNLNADAALRQQSAQATALQNQKAQLEMQGDQALRDSIKSNTKMIPVGAPASSFPAPAPMGTDDEGHTIYPPGYHEAMAASVPQAPLPDIDGIVRDMNAKGYGDRALTYLQSYENARTTHLKNLQDNLKLDETRNGAIGERLEGLLSLAKPKGPGGPIDPDGLAQAQAAYPALASELNDKYNAGLPQQFDLGALDAHYRMRVGHDQVLKDQQAALTLPETEARTANVKATTAATETETKFKNLDLNWIQGQADKAMKSPDDAAQVVSQFIDPKEHPQEYTDALRAYGGIMSSLPPTTRRAEGVKLLMGLAQSEREQQQKIDLETNPKILAARKYQAVSTAVATEVAKANLAPGAVAGIRDPVLQRQAIEAQVKAQNEYSGKEGDAARLQAFVDAARSGNQAAAALIPIAEVREIVNRVNSQELKAAGGGVSALRQVQNWLAGKVEGKPSEATLNDVEALGNTMLDASKTTYRGKVLGLNKTMGAKFDAEPVSAIQPKAKSIPAMPTVLSSSDVGKTYLSATGKKLKITAVNPSNSKQFKADEVQ